MKYTKEQIEVHKKHLTVAEMGVIAGKYDKHPHTLRNILTGVFSYEGGDKKRQAMIKEATDLIRERVINDMEVINPQCTCDNPIIRTGYCANCQKDIEIT